MTKIKAGSYVSSPSDRSYPRKVVSIKDGWADLSPGFTEPVGQLTPWKARALRVKVLHSGSGIYVYDASGVPYAIYRSRKGAGGFPVWWVSRAYPNGDGWNLGLDLAFFSVKGDALTWLHSGMPAKPVRG